MLLTKNYYDFSCDFNSFNGQDRVNLRILKNKKEYIEVNNCEKLFCDNFNYDVYLASIEALVSSTICADSFENIGINLRSVLIEYSEKLNIKEPEIYWLSQKNLEYAAYASPANEICIKPLGYCNLKEKEAQTSKILNDVSCGGEGKSSLQKLSSIYSFVMEELNNEPAFLLENVLHELTHINQFAYAKELLDGKDISAPYELMHIYAIMKSCCLEVNKDYFGDERLGYYYDFSANELDARRCTLDELMRLSKCKDLSDETRDSILSVFRADMIDEILRFNTNLNCPISVLDVLDFTRDEFERRFGAYDFAKKLIERCDELSCNASFLGMLVQYDKLFQKQIKYALEAEKETPYNKLCSLGVELAIDYKLNNCYDNERNQ